MASLRRKWLFSQSPEPMSDWHEVTDNCHYNKKLAVSKIKCLKYDFTIRWLISGVCVPIFLVVQFLGGFSFLLRYYS